MHLLSPSLEGGLSRVAEGLGLQRVGQSHQAGSDSLLTSNLFFKLKQLYPYQFNQVISESNNDIYGYQNDHAYIPTGPRINSHTVAATTPISI
jgi:hypothetical protein